MKRFSKLSAAVVTTIAITAAACGSTGPSTSARSTTSPPQGSSATSAPPAAASSPAAPTPRAAGAALPDALNVLEADAEDIIDQVAAGNWKKIGTDVDEMSAALDTYRSAALNDGASQADIDALDSALATLRRSASARGSAGAAQAANDVSRTVVELFALYDVPHPVEIGRLDVIGRQIVIDAQAGDAAAADAQVKDATSQWSAIAADVKSRNADVATQAEATVDALAKASIDGDTTTLTTQAKVLLEVVDAMERLY